MDLAWKRLDAEPEPEEVEREGSASDELAIAPLSETPRPWILWIAADDGDDPDAERAAGRFLRARGLPVVSPPPGVPLPIAVHQLRGPGARGERVLYLPRLHESFYDTRLSGSFSALSPLYLLPALSRIASEGEPLTVVATATRAGLEVRGQEVLAQRGLSSRFEIRSLPPATRTDSRALPAPSPSPSPDRVEPLRGWQQHLARGLSASDPDRRRVHYADALREAPEEALCHLFVAGTLLEGRRLGEALDALRRAIDLDPALASAHYEMGKARIQNDDLEGAIASFRRTVELLPEYASAWGNLGAALGEKQDLGGAVEALHRAVALDPGSHALHSNLGVACRDRGRLDEAERAFHRALAIDPGFVFGHYNLAHTLYLGGRYPESIAAFERAQSLDASRSPRQGLLLAATRLAAGDVAGAEREYRGVFGRLSGAMKSDLRVVAEWDLEELARRRGTTEVLSKVTELVRSLG
jgi:Flp pilus assembly protein TadD